MRSRAVATESGEQGGTHVGRVRTPVVWGQGIQLRLFKSIHRPSDPVPSRATLADTALSRATPAGTAPSRAAPADSASRFLIAVEPGVDTSSALSSVRDAIDPTPCPAATRESSVRAEADEADTNRTAEAVETESRASRDTDKMKVILASFNHLIRLDSLFFTKTY
jgi:hypothetical protein